MKKITQTSKKNGFDEKMKAHEALFSQWTKDNIPDIDLLDEWQQTSIFNLYRKAKGFEIAAESSFRQYKQLLEQQKASQSDISKIFKASK